MLRSSSIAILLVHALLSYAQPVRGEPDPGYRFAGVIITVDERLAIIERADGGQSLYRPGDRLDRYTVASIERGGVRLVDSEQELWLPLAAVPVSDGEVAAVTRARSMVVTDGHASQALDYREARRALRALARSPGESADPAGTGLRERELSGRIARALGLPQATVIKSVDRDAVSSPQEALLYLAARLEANTSMRLEIDGMPGVQVLYARPDEQL